MRPRELTFSTVLLILLLISATAIGQSFTKENRIEKSYPIYDDLEIEITNKYGDITVESWEKDSVKIVINYKVTSTKEVKLNKTFDAISFDFKANEYYVVAKTEFVGGGSFWSDVSDIASNLFTGGTNSSIDYKIYAPDDIKLTLNLKYGNIYFADHRGYLKVALSNGDFKAHSLIGKTEMEVDFADLTINNLSDGDIRVNYGSLIVEETDKLKISGLSSEYEISTVNELTVDSKRDKINIEDVSIITGDTYFSHMVVDNVSKNITLKTKYGSFKVKEIAPGTEEINLNTNNTTVNVYLQNSGDYNINITSDEKADITYSAELGDFSTNEIEGKEKVLNAKCLYGNKQYATPIVIDIRAGLLSIKLDK